MLRALIRTFFKGVLALLVAVAAFGVYHLYRSGSLPRVQEAIEDATIVGSVRAAYAIHRDLAHRAIRVEADAGRVVLSGGVANAKERSAAEDLARSVEGVEAVDNRLEIEGNLETTVGDPRSLGERIDDVALLAKVRAALTLDREMRALDLDVGVASGVVVVRGRVPTEALRLRILERVTTVAGVAKVEDELELESD